MNEELVTVKGVMAALLVLRSIVPGEHPEISEGTASVWHARLLGFSTPDVMDAALDYSGTRFPSREEFLQAVRDTRRARRAGAAQVALEGVETGRCPHCEGSGWELLSTAPWTARECPRGCEPPLPPHSGARAEYQARAARKKGEPAKVDSKVIDVTHRIQGDRDSSF